MDVIRNKGPPKNKIAQLQSWQNFYSCLCILCYDPQAIYFNGELKKRAFRAEAFVGQFMYVCDYVTRCYRLCPKIVDDTQVINLKLDHDFIIKLFTLCVVKCSFSVMYVSIASLGQPLRQSLLKNREYFETSGFFTLLVDWKHIIEKAYISYTPIRGLDFKFAPKWRFELGLKSIIYNKPTRCNSGSMCLLKTTSMLYVFRVPFTFIIRSTINCNSSHWCLSWVGLE